MLLILYLKVCNVLAMAMIAGFQLFWCIAHAVNFCNVWETYQGSLQ